MTTMSSVVWPIETRASSAQPSSSKATPSLALRRSWASARRRRSLARRAQGMRKLQLGPPPSRRISTTISCEAHEGGAEFAEPLEAVSAGCVATHALLTRSRKFAPPR